MHLSRVTIRNFRNIEGLAVDLRPGLNVIVGANNVGKTNFAAAIQVALGQSTIGESDIRILPDGRRSDELIQVSLFFSSLSAEEQAQFVDILDFNVENPAESTASIHFEASWRSASTRPTWSRWAGDRKRTEAAVPDDVLQGLRVTLLTALRDATAELLPGPRSRLGRLLRLLANEDERQEITEVIQLANKALKSKKLVTETRDQIQDRLTGASGERFAQQVEIATAAPRFESIVNTLRLVLHGSGSEGFDPMELGTNGLGYNNLIYIATVLSELAASDPTDAPLLIVEEPEAHLHPQLQCVLSSFLSEALSGTRQVQTILTTHSPTIAAHVPPETIQVFHRDEAQLLVSARIDQCGLTDRELASLRRLLDVTKATLLFANGVILVEGISEAFLLPVLAGRNQRDLEKNGVSVVPVYGVDFGTLIKLFGENRLRIRTAVVTDGDPGEVESNGELVPAKESDGRFKRSPRIAALMEKRNRFVDIFVSDVTLEYDLAAAGPINADVMVAVWEQCYERRPKVLTQSALAAVGSDQIERARKVWRGICHSRSAVGKPEFAQKLAILLQREEGCAMVRFDTPGYLDRAFDFVLKKGRDKDGG